MTTRRNKIKIHNSWYRDENMTESVNGFEINLEPYPCSLKLGFSKKIACDAFVTATTNGVIHMIINEVTYLIIAHEVSHVMDNISDYICEQLKGEARAYMTEHIMDQIIKVCKRTKRKIK